jgi:hypothetical protein
MANPITAQFLDSISLDMLLRDDTAKGFKSEVEGLAAQANQYATQIQDGMDPAAKLMLENMIGSLHARAGAAARYLQEENAALKRYGTIASNAPLSAYDDLMKQHSSGQLAIGADKKYLGKTLAELAQMTEGGQPDQIAVTLAKGALEMLTALGEQKKAGQKFSGTAAALSQVGRPAPANQP